MIIRLLLIAGTFAVVAADAQTPDTSLRQDQLYELLFREVAHYQRSAATTNPSAAEHFAGYHARTFQLDSTRAASLGTAALKCIARVSVVDKEAAMLIQAAKTKYKRASRGTIVPRPPLALMTLQKQKQTIIEATIDELENAFGEAHFTFFDRQVRSYIASRLNRQSQVITIK